MATGTIRPIKIEDEMRSSYLDYAMSVIVARALPDVRDGLKPVHRRILYAMEEMGMRPGTPYRKSARIVGEVLGKYHPHGDSPVYDALVRLAQDFSLRYPMIDGQGNFGSVDDDPPAAMRYTEARLARVSQEMLVDIDRDTVDFSDNFDGSLREPTVLPTRIPNLLINGSSGIAVGMATSIPPHNLREVCDGMIHLIDHPDAEADELMGIVQAPDFPTGGIILGQEGIREAYTTGKGRVVVRARTETEEMARSGRWQIVISELPYQVNKAALVEKIAQSAKDKKIEGISDIRDESDRHGMRVVIELRRDAQVQRVLNNLYKHTAIQSTFYMNMLALVDGQPRVLPLRSMLQEYIDFRKEVVRRRSEFDIRKAQTRVHVLAGLRIALQNLDAVIQLIRAADDAESARQGLMEQYGLDQEQAQAILDMQLRRIAALERKKIDEEFEELTKKIAKLQSLLADSVKILEVIKKETEELKNGFGDNRRTEITQESPSDFTKEELIPHQEMVVTLSDRGYIKCIPTTTYRLQHRGGKGVRGQSTREGDNLRHILVADNHDQLLFFTNRGRVYKTKGYELPPDTSRATRGMPLVNVLNLQPDETVKTIIAIPSLQEPADLVLATRMGGIKRMALTALANIRTNGLNAMIMKPGDELVSVQMATEDDETIMVSENGFSIRFPVSQVARHSRAASSIRGMRLKDNDKVVAMDLILPSGQLLVISERGYGKPTDLDRYRLQSRGGSGLKTFRITSKSGPVAAAKVVKEGEEVVIISEKGQRIRSSLSELRVLSRRTQGVSIFTLPAGDSVVSIASMEARIRTDRDTKPRKAVKEEPGVDLPIDEHSTNGHRNGFENQIPENDET
ncbi:MAG: DNA gyrase subunit A [SAR202 cluster bacterium Io17-Chloro-G3]|nr:MAG: DNA gyrase subunit A [SAR202 cluster bacterium Io17-Chloro-G3]